jgi:hypothetical protein
MQMKQGLFFGLEDWQTTKGWFTDHRLHRYARWVSAILFRAHQFSCHGSWNRREGDI